jgi:hypothetical protein
LILKQFEVGLIDYSFNENRQENIYVDLKDVLDINHTFDNIYDERLLEEQEKKKEKRSVDNVTKPFNYH